MALDTANRQAILAQIIRDFPWQALSKPNVQAAIDALDDFLDTNATAINNAIPQPLRGAATTQQKALLISYVCARRAGILKVEGE